MRQPAATSDAGDASQAEISREIADKHAQYREQRDGGGAVQDHPSLDFAPYRSSVLRHPTKAPRQVDPELIELRSPVFGPSDVSPLESDLTIVHSGAPLGERIIVQGRLLDGDGRPVRNQLIEVWQANAAGRYRHQQDQHPAPLDPNFTGAGRCITDDDGQYRFVTIKPGAYPWGNHRNAWRPAHIHFSIFGTAFTQRIVTQMYFPGDPLFPLDPIYNSIVDRDARERLVACFDHGITTPQWALGYRWDIVLSGPQATWVEPEGGDA
jgi:protocatechuate 3,4-dioxygenase beta subunit